MARDYYTQRRNEFLFGYKAIGLGKGEDRVIELWGTKGSIWEHNSTHFSIQRGDAKCEPPIPNEDFFKALESIGYLGSRAKQLKKANEGVDVEAIKKVEQAEKARALHIKLRCELYGV